MSAHFSRSAFLYPPNQGLTQIHAAGPSALGDVLTPYASSGYVWPAANRAYCVPFEVLSPIIAVGAAWPNNSVTSGNVDVGVYDAAGNRLVSSGSTAQSGSNALQSVSLTATVLAPGNYYMSMAVDNATAQFFHYSTIATPQLRVAGFQSANTSFPLPNPITFANPATPDVPQFLLMVQSVI